MSGKKKNAQCIICENNNYSINLTNVEIKKHCGNCNMHTLHKINI